MEESPTTRFAMESALAAFFRTNSSACARPAGLLRNSFLVYWKIPASRRDAGQGHRFGAGSYLSARGSRSVLCPPPTMGRGRRRVVGRSLRAALSPSSSCSCTSPQTIQALQAPASVCPREAKEKVKRFQNNKQTKGKQKENQTNKQTKKPNPSSE